MDMLATKYNIMSMVDYLAIPLKSPLEIPCIIKPDTHWPKSGLCLVP